MKDIENNRMISIFQRVIEILEKKEVHIRCICDCVNALEYNCEIDGTEAYQIKNFLTANKPTPENIYKEFTNHTFWKGNNQYYISASFWWFSIHREEETRPLRIDYLKQVIHNLK